jgi:hypothetical protein
VGAAADVEKADLREVGGGDVGGGDRQALVERPVHVGLAGGEPDLADEEIGNGERLAGGLDDEGMRAAGRQGGQAHEPVAPGVALGAGLATGEGDAHAAERRGPAPDGEGLVALEHGVILKGRGELQRHGGGETERKWRRGSFASRDGPPPVFVTPLVGERAGGDGFYLDAAIRA